METIQDIAARILSVPQDLSDLRAGDSVVIILEEPNDLHHPLSSAIWQIDEASAERLTFTMLLGPDLRRHFDRQGIYQGCSWDDSYNFGWQDRRLYRLTPEIEYLRLWSKLYRYILSECSSLWNCTNDQLRQLHRALQRLDPQQFPNETRLMQIGDMKVWKIGYDLNGRDPFLQSTLTQDGVSDLTRVRVGTHLIWAHPNGTWGWRLGRIQVTRTTHRAIWVGEKEIARKFDREGSYRNQTRLDSMSLYEERNDRLLRVSRETERLLVRQQLLGDLTTWRWTLLRKLPVEGLAALYPLLGTFPHAAAANQEEREATREIDQGLALLPTWGIGTSNRQIEVPGMCLNTCLIQQPRRF